ncbi:uncharacterized protein JCM6883_001986 [Sporobolomyces salmoneus]|uniref:uncharacterized protein n=1 Tax=Sporobolomyces salmoneus TaxID=183962 RepID=UPI00316FEB01
MRSFFVSFFALAALASFVFANPEPVPEPNRVVVVHPVNCGGMQFGVCPARQVCTQGPRQGQFRCLPPAPVPSRRIALAKKSAFCQEGAVACPIMGQLHGFECVHIKTDLEQCGDCAVLGGVDCSSLPGVADVACVNGFCRVEGCTSGFVFDFRKRTCVPSGNWNVQPQLQQA